MNETPWLTDPLWDQPEGTVEPLGGGRYLVKGRTTSYTCRPAEGTCDCPHHHYRMVPGECCRHQRRLRDWLQEQGFIQCERCEGQGCPGCEHSGVVKPGEKRAAELSDEELLALFA